MPVKSQQQREFLNWKFGHEWVKKHHFGQKGKLPHKVHKRTAKKMSDPSETINFASVPSYWQGGALKTGRKFPISFPSKDTARIQIAEKPIRLSELMRAKWNARLSKGLKYNDPSRLVRLNNNLDSIIQFDWYAPQAPYRKVPEDISDEELDKYGGVAVHPGRLARTAAIGVGAAGVGVGGYYANKAIQQAGGYRANLAGAKMGYGLERQGVGAFVNTPAGVVPRAPITTGGLGYNIGSKLGIGRGIAGDIAKEGGQVFRSGMAGAGTSGLNIAGKGLYGAGKVAGKVGQYGKLGWGKLAGLFARMRGLSSNESLIHFDEHILQPFGAEEKSKIAQEQFPAGLSPAAALQLPFPMLMRLLKQRNILQQQFPGFSNRMEKLTELSSKLDEINFQYNDDDQRRPFPWGAAAKGGAIGGGVFAAGLGGYKLHEAIARRQGAMRAAMPITRPTYAQAAGNLAGTTIQAAKRLPGEIGTAIGAAGQTAYRNVAAEVSAGTKAIQNAYTTAHQAVRGAAGRISGAAGRLGGVIKEAAPVFGEELRAIPGRIGRSAVAAGATTVRTARDIGYLTGRGAVAAGATGAAAGRAAYGVAKEYGAAGARRAARVGRQAGAFAGGLRPGKSLMSLRGADIGKLFRRGLTRARLTLSDKETRLINLNSQLDDIIEFGLSEKGKAELGLTGAGLATAGNIASYALAPRWATSRRELKAVRALGIGGALVGSFAAGGYARKLRDARRRELQELKEAQ